MKILQYTTYILVAVIIVSNAYHSSTHYCETLHGQGRVYSQFVMDNCKNTFDRLNIEAIQSLKNH